MVWISVCCSMYNSECVSFQPVKSVLPLCVYVCRQAGGAGQAPFAHDKINIPSIVDRDLQEVCGSSRILTALVLKFAGVRWGAVALLTSYLMLNT